MRKLREVNANNPITFFEILTACYFYKAAQYPDNLNLIEAGLFHRFDATNILKNNLASIVTSISKDHLDWLPENERTIDKIIFEKTSNLLNSNIIVAKQYPISTLEKIKKLFTKINLISIFLMMIFHSQMEKMNSFIMKINLVD